MIATHKLSMKGGLFIFSIVAIYLLFLLLPGLIGKKIIDLFFTLPIKKEFNFFILDSFIIGVFSYIPIIVIKITFGCKIYIFDFLNNIKETNPKVDPLIVFEILSATLFSVLISVVFSKITESDFIFKVANKRFRLPKKSFSPGIVYDIYSRKELSQKYFERWVLFKIRSYPDIEYIGNITRWHYFEKDIDFLLERVTVYNRKSNNNYEIDSLVLRVAYNDFILEILNPVEQEVN